MSRDFDHDFYLACEAEVYRNPAQPTTASTLVFWATVPATILCFVLTYNPLLTVAVLFGGALVCALLHKMPPPTKEFKIDRARYRREKESCR